MLLHDTHLQTVRVLAAAETSESSAIASGGQSDLLTPELYIATNRFNTKPNKVRASMMHQNYMPSLSRVVVETELATVARQMPASDPPSRALGIVIITNVQGPKFEKRWAERKSRLAELDGFKFFTLLRRVDVKEGDEVCAAACLPFDDPAVVLAHLSSYLAAAGMHVHV